MHRLFKLFLLLSLTAFSLPGRAQSKFEITALRGHTKVPEGHEGVGYYAFNLVRAVEGGQLYTLRCWKEYRDSSPCYTLRANNTYDAEIKDDWMYVYVKSGNGTDKIQYLILCKADCERDAD